MTQVQPRQLNGGLTYDADLVNAWLRSSKKSQGLSYTTTSGWGVLGALGVSVDQNFKVGVETVPVENGAIITEKDMLIQRLTGEANFQMIDMNPLAGQASMGTVPDIVWDTGGTAWSGTIITTGTTKTVIALSTGNATGLAVNDVLRFTLGSGTNTYYYPGIVDAFDTTTDLVTLRYALPEIPGTGTVTRVRGYDLFHGGNVLQHLKLLVQLDFPKGDQHIMEIKDCSSTAGYSRVLSGAVKTPMAVKMYGVLTDIGSYTDQVTCAVTHVGFPNR